MKKKKHVLQWHILHKCNLRCSHCYQEDYVKECSFDELEKVFYQYLSFCEKNNFIGHINFTGGEPFLSEYLFVLIDLCDRYEISYGILTNGTLIDSRNIELLKKCRKLSFVQISIDGNRETHDNVRGQGNFDKAFCGLELLKKSGIQTMVAFTCHKKNKDELKELIKIVRRRKIDRFWVDRLIPIGSNTEDVLSTDEYREVIQLLTCEHNRKKILSNTQIHLNRALQFLEGGECYYRCSAGITLLTVLADGTLLPCRRLPISIGNCFENDMTVLYENSGLIKDLQKNEIPHECIACPKAEMCMGGAKCFTYAMTGDYHGKDMNCYLVY